MHILYTTCTCADGHQGFRALIAYPTPYLLLIALYLFSCKIFGVLDHELLRETDWTIDTHTVFITNYILNILIIKEREWIYLLINKIPML